jgi:hypothetical protein
MREVREVHASPLQQSSSQQSPSQQSPSSSPSSSLLATTTSNGITNSNNSTVSTSLLALEQELSEFETSFEHEHHKLSASQIQTDSAEMRALVNEHRKHMQVM